MTTDLPEKTTRSNNIASLLPITDDLEVPAVLLRDACHLEILIPARNEAQRLPRTLRRTIEYLEAQPYSSSIVVVDNGSFDHTADLASRVRSARVPVHLTGCARRGKGAAIRRGILTSRAQYVGYMDADLATPIETLDTVMPLLGENTAVVGSRRMRGAVLAQRQPTHRALGGMVFRALSQRILQELTDTQCGFKFFAGDLARAAARQMTIDGFAFDVEMLHIIAGIGAQIIEVPVTWTDAKGSKLDAMRDGARAALDLYRLSNRGAA
jgi:dolichyl-phosphate beta-glucosyltransferase